MIIRDSFIRPNTSTSEGLGFVSTPKNGFEWENVSGLWRILNNSAYTSSSAGSSPIVVIDTRGANFRISARAGTGGDAIYARVKDENNWIRIRTRHSTSTAPTYRTEYEWKCVTRTGTAPYKTYEWACVERSGTAPWTSYLWEQDYRYDDDIRPAPLGESGDTHGGEDLFNLHLNVQKWSVKSDGTNPPYYSDVLKHMHYLDPDSRWYPGDTEYHSHAKSGSTYWTGQSKSMGGYSYSTTYKWSRSNTSSPCSSAWNSYLTGDTRDHGGYTYSTTYTWSTSRTNSPCGSVYSSSLTGRTRQVYDGSTTSQQYFIVLEACVNGAVTTLGNIQVGTAPGALMLEGIGDNLRGGYNGHYQSTLSKTSSANNTGTRHGLGKGPSDIINSNLSYIEIDTLDSEVFYERWGEVLI